MEGLYVRDAAKVYASAHAPRTVTHPDAVPVTLEVTDPGAALWSQTSSLRLELQRRGTAVTGLHIGYADTDLVGHD